MRERLFALGLLGLLAGSPSVWAHEEGTTPPSPEGTAGGSTGQPATRPLKAAPPKVAPTVKPAQAPQGGKPGSRPLRLTLEEKDRPALSPSQPAGPRDPSKAEPSKAEPAPPGSRPSTPTALPGTESGEAVVVKKAPLKLAPSAKEIESERQTVLKPPVENRPDRYENQRQDIPSPTQVRRVPGPGSGVGSTASERKATMIENSGPQQNTTYRRW